MSIPSNRRRRQLLAGIPALLLGRFTSPAFAAEITSSQERDAVITRLLEIIDQVGIIIPGEGFKSIKLGDPFEKLVRLWGKPKSVNRKGTVSYLLSHKTVIHFSGKKSIETIVVVGKAGSLAHVNNGVVFGMTQGQVLAQFSATPDKHKRDLIRYKDLGIELGFKSGTLAEIAVFKP